MFNRAATYTLTGNTYRNRHFIKDLGASWDADNKAWIVKGQLLDDTVWRLRRMGVKVAISR